MESISNSNPEKAATPLVSEGSVDIDETSDAYPGWADFGSLHGIEGDGGGCSGRWQGWGDGDMLGYSHIAFDEDDDGGGGDKESLWWMGELGAEEEYDGQEDGRDNFGSEDDDPDAENVDAGGKTDNHTTL